MAICGLPIKSRTFANEETSKRGLPSDPSQGARFVAAESVRFAPAGCERSAWRNVRKLLASSALRVLHPMPSASGNSQLNKHAVLQSEDVATERYKKLTQSQVLRGRMFA